MGDKYEKHISLPEIFLSPSKRINAQANDDVWKKMEENTNGNQAYKPSNYSEEGNVQQHLKISKEVSDSTANKGLRGETPGSDSPGNVLVPQSLGIASKIKLPLGPEKNLIIPENRNLYASSGRNKNFSPMIPRRSVEGADSSEEMQVQKFSIDKSQEDKCGPRKSPAGISSPQLPSTSANIDDSHSVHETSVELVRPPALGQSHDLFYIFNRKDLGSTDGEDSCSESLKQNKGAVPKFLSENCSVGSLSENTDSTSTVLDMKRGPVLGCEYDTPLLNDKNNLSKPNFIVGGAISPRVIKNHKGSVINYKRSLTTESTKDQKIQNKDDSLTSMVSVESTHPESSECITSPSVISVSSVASSKKLEWDSGADVGYSGKLNKRLPLNSSLSTLERIAIGSYASVLRTEPEGKGNSFQKSRVTNRNTNTGREKVNKFSKPKVPGNIAEKKVLTKKHPNIDRKEFRDFKFSPSSDEYEAKNVPVSPKKGRKGALGSHRPFTNDAIANKNSVISLQKASEVSDPGKSSCYPAFPTSIPKEFKTFNNQNTSHVSSQFPYTVDPEKKTVKEREQDPYEASALTSDDNAQSLPVSKSKNDSLRIKTKESNSLDNTMGKKTLHSLVWDRFADSKRSFGVSSNLNVDTSLQCSKDYDQSSLNKSSTKESNESSDQSSYISIESINIFLSSLSKKLQLYINNMMENGDVEKLDDYVKLQDYIEFVGIPSNNEEEVKLKESVADIIMRMFADVNVQGVESSSSTINTDDVNPKLISSHSPPMFYNVDSSTPKNGEIKDSSASFPDCLNKFENASSEGNRPISCIPYRPPSATMTYYIATKEEQNEIGFMGEQQSKEANKTCGIADEQKWESVSENSFKELVNHEADGPYSSNNLPSNIKNFDSLEGKALYQDWHGIIHIAHQPPGYSSCVDSHLSESTSENDQGGSNDPKMGRNQEDLERERPNAVPMWTSTGSESAYETIRERGRNVGETLASSFEFYSTSPRDARLLGYVSNESKNAEEEESCRTSDPHQNIENLPLPSVPPPVLSANTVDLSSSVTSVSYRSDQKVVRKTHRKSRTRRKPPNAETEDSSTSSSLIRVKKQKYVRKMSKYINTLENLERALMQSCESQFSLADKQMPPPKSRTNIRKENSSSHEPIGQSDYYVSEPCSTDFTSSENRSCASKPEGDSEYSSSIHRKVTPKKSKHKSYSSLEETSSNISSKTFDLVSENQKTNVYPPRGRSELESASQVSDFRKLMAGGNAEGGIRPYRFLLKGENRRMSSKEEQNEVLQGHKFPFESSNKISHVRSLEEEGSFLSNEGTFQENSLVSNEEDRLNNEAKESKGEMEQTLTGTGVSDISEFSIRVEKMALRDHYPKEMKEFGQMFPSDSNIDSCRVSQRCVSIQTGISLLILNEPSPSLEDEQFTEPAKSSVPELIKQGSLLQEMEERIKINAEKINSALEAYNKKFLSHSGRLLKSSKDIQNSQILSGLPNTKNTIDLASKNSLQSYNFANEFIDDSQKDLTDDCSTKVTNFRKEIIKVSEKGSKSSEDSSMSGCQTEVLEELYHENPVDFDQDDPAPMSYKKIECSTSDSSVVPRNSYLSSEFKGTTNIEASKSDYYEKALSKRKESKSQETTTSKSKNGVKFTVQLENIERSQPSLNQSLVEELITINKENEIMTLQEALSLARPNYMKEAERRRMKICKRQAIRHKLQTHNQNILAELPDNLKTPTLLKKFLLKSEESPLFSYKDMRDQNRKLYEKLPEASKQTDNKRRAGVVKTNRIMANVYSQRLRLKAIKGKVSHTHKAVLTPIR